MPFGAGLLIDSLLSLHYSFEVFGRLVVHLLCRSFSVSFCRLEFCSKYARQNVLFGEKARKWDVFVVVSYFISPTNNEFHQIFSAFAKTQRSVPQVLDNC